MISVYCSPQIEVLVRKKLEILKKRTKRKSPSQTVHFLIEKAWKEVVDEECKKYPSVPRGIIERSILIDE